ncbi:MAG: protoglobin domain-containing protein [Pirellulales bacterium]
MDPHELYGRYRELQAYVGWSDDDAGRVAVAFRLLEPHFSALVDDFYAEMDRHPNARRAISEGRDQVVRLKKTLIAWLGDLFSGRYDRHYVHTRWKVGRKHVDVGLEQAYVSAALSRLRKGLIRALVLSWNDERDALFETVESLNMLLDLDLAIIQDAYEDEYKSRVRKLGKSTTDQPAR